MLEEKEVLKALACKANDPVVDCTGCPYQDRDSCDYQQICKDALALLKEQTPRVMTQDEVLHSSGNPVWFESRGRYLGLKGFWCLSLEVDPELHIRFVQSVTGGKITLSLIDYGKAYRFWTSHPTEEQRKAVKWND